MASLIGAKALCHDVSYDAEGNELRCVASAGHLDERQGHEYVLATRVKHIESSDSRERSVE